MAEALDQDELAAIRESLLQWRSEGVADPIMPAYADEDGNSLPDFYGLDAFGRLERRPDGTVGTNVAVEFGETGSEGP